MNLGQSREALKQILPAAVSGGFLKKFDFAL